MPETPPTTYRLAPAVVARLLGVALVALALLLLLATAVAVLTGLGVGALVMTAVLVAVGCLAGAWWLRRAWVLRCTGTGYRVRLVRGVGVAEARWSAVEDVVATYRHGVACLQLRLRDGGTTTVPVGVLAADREELVRHLQDRLQHGHGLRPL